jgi:hypothetical protein
VNEWQPIETAPNDLAYESGRRVDLWVRIESSGYEFRAPNCFRRNGMWLSDHHSWELKFAGWKPLYWMHPPDPPAGANLEMPEMRIRKMSDIIRGSNGDQS